MIFECSADSLEISRPLAMSLVTCSPPIAITFVYTIFSSIKTVIFEVFAPMSIHATPLIFSELVKFACEEAIPESK